MLIEEGEQEVAIILETLVRYICVRNWGINPTELRDLWQSHWYKTSPSATVNNYNTEQTTWNNSQCSDVRTTGSKDCDL